MSHDRDGQATVEAALTLPIVLITLLLVVQVGIVVRDALALELAAREGAREAAVTADGHKAREVVRQRSGPLDADRVEIQIVAPEGWRRGEAVTVRLRYEHRLSVPVVDRMLDLTLPLNAAATMRLERAP